MFVQIRRISLFFGRCRGSFFVNSFFLIGSLQLFTGHDLFISVAKQAEKMPSCCTAILLNCSNMFCLLSAVTGERPRNCPGTGSSVCWQQRSWTTCNCAATDLPSWAPGSPPSQDTEWSWHR